MTSKTVNETIIEGPDGILKIYENNNPNNIPKNENKRERVAKLATILYVLACQEHNLNSKAT